MGKDIIIRGNTYLGADTVDIPLANEQGTAQFIDPSGSTLSSGSQMLDGVKAHDADGVMITGTIESTKAQVTAQMHKLLGAV